MPAIGLGTWKAKNKEVKEAVITAIKAGYRHIDCAEIYGNEAAIGEAITQCISEGIVTRKELWITSKLWNNAHKREDVAPAIDQTLKNLQLEYLDLYLMHWPVAFKPEVRNAEKANDYLTLNEVPLEETWAAMLEIKKAGKARNLGVSNFSMRKLGTLIMSNLELPEMNQVELHPFLQQENLLKYCKDKDIHLTAYSPLGSGDRSEGMKAEDEPNLLENDTIQEIASALDVTAGQVLIAYHLHRDTAVIPKSTNEDHIKENLAAAHITFSNEQLDKLRALDRHYRYVTGKFFEIPGNGYDNIYDEVLAQ